MPVSPRRGATPTSLPTTSHRSEAESPLAARIAATSRPHNNNHPLWAGPCGAGPLGGITQSMLVRFMSCRERFRLKYVLGLEPHDRWNHRLGYGNMWHLCEEVFAADRRGLTGEWQERLEAHVAKETARYRMQEDEIVKWLQVCRVQFPEYVAYWQDHPDVQNRLPLVQEQVFDVPHALPSGRAVRLRGKFDSVDLIDGAVYLQENKSKGDIDKVQVERQLKFDLQTMMYLTALRSMQCNVLIMNRLREHGQTAPVTVNGVRYNVIRRPLSGGRGTIKQSEGTLGAKCTRCKMDPDKMPTCPKCCGAGRIGAKPAETDEAFYGRLRDDYIKADPDYWFFRVRSEVSARDVEVFRDTCLDPLLEQLCWWYDEVTNKDMTSVIHDYGYPPMSYRTPFGVYSALEDGGSTEYDAFLETGSEVGLRRTEKLFTELQD